MNRTPYFHFLLSASLGVILPQKTAAKNVQRSEFKAFYMNKVVADSSTKQGDSLVFLQQQEKQQEDKNQKTRRKEEEQDKKKQDSENSEIKQVPKAKRQEMPTAVEPKIRVPIKRINPIIRKPVRIIKRNLGIKLY